MDTEVKTDAPQQTNNGAVATFKPSANVAELIRLNQEEDAKRAQKLAVLSPENREHLLEMVKYTSIAPDPVTEEFQWDWMLGDAEYPTMGAKAAQSLNECNGRMETLIGDEYQYLKTEIEMHKLEADLKLKRGEISEEDHKDLHKQYDIQMLELEIQQKQYNLRRIKLVSNVRFSEAIAWKKNAEKAIKKMGLKSIDEFKPEQVRPELMRAKVFHWGMKHAEGALERTPSLEVIITSHRDIFDRGVREGLRQLQQTMSPQNFAAHCQRMGFELVPVAADKPTVVKN